MQVEHEFCVENRSGLIKECFGGVLRSTVRAEHLVGRRSACVL